MENIPNNLKGVIFLLIFAIIFGGSIYILKILINKHKKKKLSVDQLAEKILDETNYRIYMLL